MNKQLLYGNNELLTKTLAPQTTNKEELQLKYRACVSEQKQ